MMQELRLVLIILGAVAIAALLLHGLWTSRKEKPAKFGEKPIGKLTDPADAGFDQDGIGSVRVIKAGNEEKPKADRKEPGLSFGDKPDVDPLFATHSDVGSSVEKEHEIDLPTFSASDTDEADSSTAEMTEPVKNSSPVDFYQSDADDEDDANINHSVEATKVESKAEERPQSDDVIEAVDEEPAAAPIDESPKAPQQQVLILNVQAGTNQEFNGEELINCLEQHGMIFGEMEIYHRHADLAGTGQVLFSAANMFNPGSFPLATIHQFTTPGITLFMTLPCYGEAEQNFKLMLQTAQQVADQLGGLVTDDKRSMMTPQRLDSYREKIKQFHSHA
ncbi:cell division protein ZipA [Enterovibrio norvegicus FF-454]|uniref:Cell division protein ZipA n=1 Tax=Enterovibrio norvegicus FF-454 TaxID=1185651 RepID=A0A1E5C688_9GAMM|nr:cell division protein ZipA [Enterovibrio norvegicus]OEE60979.1 cell division protein ZipA [Enterovibrio norvegicus FF-454]